ncbi:hypothetical protein BDW71DRAFT_201602 [Aspergillus fruticulosus]
MNQTLLQHLSISLPPIPVGGTHPSRNTTNPRYGADDITEINQQYGTVVQAKQIRIDSPTSPSAAIRDELQFHLRFTELVLPRVRRSLRAAFEQFAPELVLLGLSPIAFDGGSAAKVIDLYPPDTAYMVVGGNPASSFDRALGDLKVLAQVSFYMRQHGARYVYILTNTEFVAVKRLEVLLALWYIGMLAAGNANWAFS